ncbi:MAG: hypothetical protein ACRCSO_03950, partial [Sphingomonas sp.]
MKLNQFLGATALVGILACYPAAAFAQTATPSADTSSKSDDDAKKDKEIVVTGSRIARPNLESNVPLTSVSQDYLEQTASVSIGDTLNHLPALRSTFS